MGAVHASRDHTAAGRGCPLRSHACPPAPPARSEPCPYRSPTADKDDRLKGKQFAIAATKTGVLPKDMLDTQARRARESLTRGGWGAPGAAVGVRHPWGRLSHLPHSSSRCSKAWGTWTSCPTRPRRSPPKVRRGRHAARRGTAARRAGRRCSQPPPCTAGFLTSDFCKRDEFSLSIRMEQHRDIIKVSGGGGSGEAGERRAPCPLLGTATEGSPQLPPPPST